MTYVLSCNETSSYLIILLFISAQRVLEKSCFLTPGHNDTCFDDPVDSSVGICWCHTNLCNGGNRWSSPPSITTTLFLISFLAWPGLGRINLMVWIDKRIVNFNMQISSLIKVTLVWKLMLVLIVICLSLKRNLLNAEYKSLY